MAYPGVKVPPSRHPKKGAETAMTQSPGSKEIKDEMLRLGQASDVGSAPTSRVYTRDYSKVGREEEDVDLVSPALGNPLGL